MLQSRNVSEIFFRPDNIVENSKMSWQLGKSIFTYQKDPKVQYATARYMAPAQIDIHLPEEPKDPLGYSHVH